MNTERAFVALLMMGAMLATSADGRIESRRAEIASLLRPEAGFAETRIDNREFWSTYVSDWERRTWLKAGEEALALPIPRPEDARFFPREGKDIDDSTWISTVEAAFGILEKLVCAECLEGKGRFIPRIEEVLEAIGRFPTWTGFYHDRQGRGYRGECRVLDLGSGTYSERLAIVLDKLRSRLDPDCRARAVANLRAMTLDVYLALASDPTVAKRHSCGWFRSRNNWNSACNRYFVSAAIHVLDDPKERATAIEFAGRSSKEYLKSFTADGLCLEGCGYWAYGFGNYMSLALWVKAATGSWLDFVPEPFLRKCFTSSYETEYVKGRMPLYGDCNISTHGKVQHLARYIWPEFDYFGINTLFGASCGFLVAAIGDLKTQNWKKSRPYPYPLRSWYPDRIGLLLCRPVAGAQPSDRIYAAIQGGYCARPHGHHDVGSYSIAPGGIDVMGDLGNSKYTYDTFGPKRFENPLRNSYGHPVPRVDGRLQSSGERSFATVLRTSFSEVEDRVVYDMKTAYRDVKNLKSLVRGFRYDRASNRVEVVDRVVFDGKGMFETAFTTTGKVEDLGNGIYRFVSRNGQASACCRVRVKGATWHFAQEQLPGEVGSQWNTPGKSFPAYRQAVVLDEPVETADVSVLWFGVDGSGQRVND